MKDNPGQTGSRRGRQALSAVTAGVMNQDSRPFHELPAIRRWGKKPAEERRTSMPGFPIRTGVIHDAEIINYRTDPFVEGGAGGQESGRRDPVAANIDL